MKRILFCIAIGFLNAACALTTDSIDVPYQPTQVFAPVAGAQNASVIVTGNDARTTYRDRVSTKKNGYGMEMAPILSTNDVAQTTALAIQQELASIGFKIGPGGAQVAVDVVKFYNDFKSGFFAGDAAAEVDLNVKVLAPDREMVFSKYYSGVYVLQNIQLAGGDNAREALIPALGKAVDSVVSDPELQRAVLKAQKPGEGARRPKTS